MEVPLRNASLFTLSRHHLLERAPRNQALEVVDEILGLNAQGAINFQLSLWNRVTGLETSFIPRALYEDRSLVKTWLMRNTVHIIPSTRLPIYRRALERSLLREWNRWTVRTGAKQSVSSWERMYPDVLDALEGGPLMIRQMQEVMGWLEARSRVLLSRLVREMSLRGLICHAQSSGPWYHNTGYTFARVDRWLPQIDLYSVSEEEAVCSLAQSYLKAYGPASIRDFAYWTGMRLQEARPVFNSLSDSLVKVTVAKHRGTFLILEGDASALLDVADRSAGARLLPKFDALIMGHKDKTRFIEPQLRSRIFLPRGEVAPTMIVDGRVRGVWSLTKMTRFWRLELSPFNEMSGDEVEAVEVEVDRLQRFSGFEIESSWEINSSQPHSP
ncbi:MAG: winged helix DNA-binding domain-containing protein [Candidatus Bathyarchaeia archaeon]